MCSIEIWEQTSFIKLSKPNKKEKSVNPGAGSKGNFQDDSSAPGMAAQIREGQKALGKYPSR